MPIVNLQIGIFMDHFRVRVFFFLLVFVLVVILILIFFRVFLVARYDAQGGESQLAEYARSVVIRSWGNLSPKLDFGRDGAQISRACDECVSWKVERWWRNPATILGARYWR